MRIFAVAFLLLLGLNVADAANCKRNGNVVTCDDGRTGVFTGDAVVWPDGTKSSSAKHPSSTRPAPRTGRTRP